MRSKAGTEIDVIALDGGEPCLFPSAPVGHTPDRGETTLGRYAPPDSGRLVLAARAQAAVPPYRLVMARYDRIGKPSPGQVARTWPVSGRDGVFARGNAWAARAAAPRTTRTSRVSTLHELSR